MTTLPSMMAMIATSLTVSLAYATPSADFNNDGNVNSTDLIFIVGSLNTTCDEVCVTDLSEDGITDMTDLMLLMQQWGPVPDYVPDDEPLDEEDDSESHRDENRDMSWQGKAPVLLDAIYYDKYTEYLHWGGYDRWHLANEYNQGEHTQAWTAANNVEVQPMAYSGFDWDADNIFTDEDKVNFEIWLNQAVPADYDGQICLDLESQWWPMLDSQNQAVVDVALDFYIEGLEFVQSLRPQAKIGFWGLPKKSHTNPDIPTASIQRLLNVCTAIFPDVYENNYNYDDSARLQLHVERCIEMINGEIPVYVQTSPRYKVDTTGYRYFHDQTEFLRDQIQASLDAAWTDSNGMEHKISGIALWDAYIFIKYYTEGWSELSMDERKALWDEIDFLHIEFLEGMKMLVDIAAAAIEAQLQTQAETEDEDSSKEVIVEVDETGQTRQPSRLIRRLYNGQSAGDLTSSDYRPVSRSYRTARRSWTQARRMFSAASRKYSRGSSEYKRALEAYEQAREEMQLAERYYRQERDANQNARASLNQAKEEWKAANADWSVTAETEQSRVASY